MRGNTPYCHDVGRGQTIYCHSVATKYYSNGRLAWQCMVLPRHRKLQQLANAMLLCVAITSMATWHKYRFKASIALKANCNGLQLNFHCGNLYLLQLYWLYRHVSLAVAIYLKSWSIDFCYTVAFLVYKVMPFKCSSIACMPFRFNKIGLLAVGLRGCNARGANSRWRNRV
jgi:hypothetical protein